jgi:hypothetical protein
MPEPIAGGDALPGCQCRFVPEADVQKMRPCRLEQVTRRTRSLVATPDRPAPATETFLAYRFLLIAVLLLLAFVDPAFANWWIVRAADNKCLVVDIEPSGNDKDITKVGKDIYLCRPRR